MGKLGSQQEGTSPVFSNINGCPSSEYLFDIVCSSNDEFMLACWKPFEQISNPPESSVEKISLYAYQNSMAIQSANGIYTKRAEYYFNFRGNTPESYLWIHDLRSVRMETNPTVELDVLFWTSWYNPQFSNGGGRNESIIYYKNDLNGEIQWIALANTITDIRMIRSKFMLINHVVKGDYSNVKSRLIRIKPPRTETVNLRGERIRIDLETIRNCMINSGEFKEQICFGDEITGKFINSVYIREEDETLFEFSVQPNEAAGIPPGSIDIYRYNHIAEKLEKIIHHWPEARANSSFRCSTKMYFWEIVVLPVNNSETEFTATFYMSNRKYKNKPRKVSDYNITIKKAFPFTFYFDEDFYRVTIGSLTSVDSFILNEPKLQISLEKMDNGSFPNASTPSPINTTGLNKYCNYYSNFNMTFGNVNVTHLICFNLDLKIGYFFFYPSTDEMNKVSVYQPTQFHEPIQIVRESLPSGLSIDNDFYQLIKGSYLKLVSNGSNEVSEISNDYLDPYRYSLKVRRAKFIESIYGVETIDGDERKVIFVISTAYENYFFVGNKFQNTPAHNDFTTWTMRDFRWLSRLYPINTTSLVVQVEELTYIVDITKKVSAPDVPSKGTNGVCNNNTVIRHDKMGPVMVCIHEGKSYIKILNINKNIQQLKTDSATSARLNSIRILKFFGSTECYENFIFLYYLEKADISTSGIPPEKLRLGIFMLKNIADPTLEFVSFNEFNNSGSDPTIVGVEMACDRIITLERQEGVTGDSRFRIYKLDNEFKIGSGPITTLDISKELALFPTPQLYLTNLMSENELDNYMNSVMYSQKMHYQISVKVILLRTKQTKILTFNPILVPFDSLTLLELPPDFLIAEIGLHITLGKNKETRTLCILGGKTQKLDEDFYNKENLNVFIVADMTPTINLKPFKNPEALFRSDAPPLSTNLTFPFNITSSLYAESVVAENKYKINEKMVFDDTKKQYILDYRLWGIPFKPKLTTENGVITTNFVSQTSKMDKKIKLDNFYARLDPRNYLEGSVKSFTGKPESTVEDFMGIIQVLNNSIELQITTDLEDNKLRTASDTALGSYVITWGCNREEMDLKTFNTGTPDQKVMACNKISSNHFNAFVGYGSRLFRILPTKNVSDYGTRIKADKTSFYLFDNTLYFLNQFAKGQVRLCNKNLSRINDFDPIEIYEKDDCNPLATMSDFSSIEMLDIAAIPFETETNTIAFMAYEYNPNLNIYSKVALYTYMKETKMLQLRHTDYVASNNLRVLTTYNSTGAVLYFLYYRWNDNTKLTLRIKKNFMPYNPMEPVTYFSHEIILLELLPSMDKLRTMIKSVEIIAPQFESQYQRTKPIKLEGDDKTEYITFVVNFKMANAYIMYVNLNDLNLYTLNKTKNYPLQNTLIAPIENPFFGFMPDLDTPAAQYNKKYFFRIANFKDQSYLISYTIQESNLKNITGITNILGLRFESDNSTSNTTIYEELKNYVQSSSIIPLSKRPIAAQIIPNFNVNSENEHQMFYVTSEERLMNMNFTSYINVRIKTNRVASRTITVNITGLQNKTQTIIFKVLGDESNTFWAFIRDSFWLVVVTGVSLLISIVVVFIISKDASMARFQNKNLMMRHSMKPMIDGISGLLSNFGNNEEEKKEEFSSDSSSSEEQKIIAKKKPSLQNRTSVLKMFTSRRTFKDADLHPELEQELTRQRDMRKR